MFSLLKSNKLIAAMLLLGLSCALWLCAVRVLTLERQNNQVAVVMSEPDIARLAEAEGTPVEEYTLRLRAEGLSALVNPGDAQNALSLYLPDGSDFEQQSGSTIIGLLEDDAQYSFVPIAGYDFESVQNGAVRVFRLFPHIARRYATLGYSGAEELTNIFYRAVTDRNIRVIEMTPFYHSETDELISNLRDYAGVIRALESRLNRQGLTLSSNIPVMPRYSPSPLLLLGVFAGICAFAAVLLLLVTGIDGRFGTIAALVCFGISAIAYFVNPALTTAGAALTASILFPCLGIWQCAGYLSNLPDWETLGGCIIDFGAILGLGVLISTIGGLFVGAIQSSTGHLLAVYNFRGVKVSQLVPVIFAAATVFRRFYGGMRGTVDAIVKGRRTLMIGAGILLIAAVAVFILRTGDGALRTSILEQRIRNIFENELFVRPRTKEFAIAYPALAVASAMIARGGKRYAWLFAIMFSPGLASVVNTFCHSRSPLYLSLARTVSGAGFGLLLGIVAIVVVYLVFPNRGNPISAPCAE